MKKRNDEPSGTETNRQPAPESGRGLRWTKIGPRLKLATASLLIAALLTGCGAADEGAVPGSGEASAGGAAAVDAASRESVAGAPQKSAAEEASSGAAAAQGSEEPSAADASAAASAAESAELQHSDAMPPKAEPRQMPEPQAGMLTAGEWDDLGAWSRWTELIQDSPYPAAWGFAPYRRLTVQATAKGKPARDVEVILQCGGKREWTARTDGKGQATLFAGLLESRSRQDVELQNEPAASSEQQGGSKDQAAAPQDCSVQIDGGNGLLVREAEAKDWAGRVMKLETDREAAQPDAVLDLLLMIDTTGSMADELSYLSTELTNVVSRVKKNIGQNLTVRISPNFYRDHNDEYVVRSFPFLEDAVKAQAHIARQEADGGQDYPEAVAEALTDAVLEHDWSRSARARLMLLVLDAPPHQGLRERESIQHAAAEAAKQGIRIVPVAASGTDLETELLLRTLAVSTGGSYVFLTDDSGIGNGHKQPEGVEPQIMPLNDLLVDLISRHAEG
ncbi:vWA domain-containing protein [Paenibacillus pasadenensis]|nr:vWA domain-containing protein [Paenibacillus pasadenensis]